MNILTFLLLNIVISFFILILPVFFKKKNNEIGSIESGFESVSNTSTKTFSINFFVVLIIFIIFDLELFFLFPLILNYNLIIMMAILFFIFTTLFLELFFKKIEWKN